MLFSAGGRSFHALPVKGHAGAPPGLRGACSGRPKSCELARVQAIAFHGAESASAVLASFPGGACWFLFSQNNCSNISRVYAFVYILISLGQNIIEILVVQRVALFPFEMSGRGF